MTLYKTAVILAAVALASCDIDVIPSDAALSYGFHMISSRPDDKQIVRDVVVTRVACDGPALHKLRVDDQILSINGIPTKDVNEVIYRRALRIYADAEIRLRIEVERLVDGFIEKPVHIIEPRPVQGPYTCGRAEGRV